MRLINRRTMSPLDTGMAGDKLPGMIDLDHFAVGQDFHPLSGQTIGHGVAVGLEGHQAVLGHVAGRSFLDHVSALAGLSMGM